MNANNYTNLGQLLRQKRLLLDLTLEDVEERTGIKARCLKALEHGNYHELPASVYIRGYLKTLSSIYGLELSRLIVLYKEDQGIINQIVNEARTKLPTKNKKIGFTLTSKTLAVGILSLMFIITTAYMAGQINHVTAAPDLYITSPEEGYLTKKTLLEIKGGTEVGSTVTINNQAIPVNPDGTFNQTIYLSSGENNIVIRASNRFNNYSEIRRRVVVASSPQVLGENTNTEESADTQTSDGDKNEDSGDTIQPKNSVEAN